MDFISWKFMLYMMRTLRKIHSLSWWPIYIVSQDQPFFDMVIVHGYVKLPAGIGNDVVDLPNIFGDLKR